MRVVLRIGGSVVASPVNPALVSAYVNLLKGLRRQGHQVAVVVGGGALAREFIGVARDLGLNERAQDDIAISVSRIYAQIFLKKLGRVGCGDVPLTVQEAAEYLGEGKVVIMGGLKPGMTTDTVAALIAGKIEADLLVKATDRDGVYDKDPEEHPDAVKFDRLTFRELSEVFPGGKHRAGIHQIIDPEAIRVLKRHRVTVIVVNGFNPENVLMAIKGKPVGTLIESA